MKKHIKLIIAAVVCLVICITVNTVYAVKYEMVRQGSVGENVQRVQLRLRELGYLYFKPTGSYKGMTVAGVIQFQKMQTTADGGWVAADGEAGEQTQSILFSTRARRASIPGSVHIPIGPSLSGTPKLRGKTITWENVKKQLRADSVYKVYDYNTGKSLRVRYVGGENHAEVECATPEDTQIFLKIFGGEYNFSKRAMVFQLNSETLIAASMFGDPHGSDNVKSNDMGGHICLFFDGSKSHVGAVTDVEHQKQIYTAAGM